MAKKSFTLAFYIFFSINSDKNKATCFLCYFDPCSILACMFSQQFRLHAKSGNRPYFRLCCKMNVLPSHFNYFFCYHGSNQRQLHVLCKILFHCHSGLCEFQQFRLRARTSSRPYSRLCGKIKILLSHLTYFYFSTVSLIFMIKLRPYSRLRDNINVFAGILKCFFCYYK